MAGRVCYMSLRQAAARRQPGVPRPHPRSRPRLGARTRGLELHLHRHQPHLTHELIRHRAGFGFSQLSQRYVDESVAEYVEPDCIADDPELHRLWLDAVGQSHQAYVQAGREAARRLQGRAGPARCAASWPGRPPAASCPTPPRPRSSSPPTPAPCGTSSSCAAAATPRPRSASSPSRCCGSCSRKRPTSSATISSCRLPTAPSRRRRRTARSERRSRVRGWRSQPELGTRYLARIERLPSLARLPLRNENKTLCNVPAACDNRPSFLSDSPSVLFEFSA